MDWHVWFTVVPVKYLTDFFLNCGFLDVCCAENEGGKEGKGWVPFSIKHETLKRGQLKLSRQSFSVIDLIRRITEYLPGITIEFASFWSWLKLPTQSKVWRKSSKSVNSFSCFSILNFFISKSRRTSPTTWSKSWIRIFLIWCLFVFFYKRLRNMNYR